MSRSLLSLFYNADVMLIACFVFGCILPGTVLWQAVCVQAVPRCRGEPPDGPLQGHTGAMLRLPDRATGM